MHLIGREENYQCSCKAPKRRIHRHRLSRRCLHREAPNDDEMARVMSLDDLK